MAHSALDALQGLPPEQRQALIDQMSQAERLSLLPEHERKEFLATLTPAELAALEYHWPFWARPKQLEPAGNWSTWAVIAGRGFGKTRCGAEWVRAQLCGDTPLARGRCRHIALVAETAADARDVMVGDGKAPGEGSGILQVCPKDFTPTYEVTKRRLTFPNGAICSIYNATEPDQLRGPQHDGAWCFIAGTLIDTARGSVPIESVQTGDRVWTRAGWRRVVAHGSRVTEVGKVRFNNGQSLVGTADHPILTSHGWTIMSDLTIGMQACVIDASNGAASAGTDTAADITNIAVQEAWGVKTAQAYIERYGARLTEKYRRATTYITKTKIAATTIWATLSACLTAGIRACTFRQIPFPSVTGNQSLILAYNASAVGGQLLERSLATRRSANVVSKYAQIKSVPRNEIANTAEPNSKAFAATSAVSVASTWEPAGRARVYNLQVEDTPEYVANGILVHNCDELAKWQYAQDSWDQLQFGLRSGPHPRVVITTTPKPIKVLKRILADPTTVTTRGSTTENAINLAPQFVDIITRRYAGTRLGRQELDAELLEDVAGAFWQRDRIDELRVRADKVPPMKRIVVAIDPAMTSGEDADETGIICAGLGSDGHGYILDDCSGRYVPIEWANRAISLFDRRMGDRIIAEVNNGGDMVEHTLRTVQKNVSYKAVRASKGKDIRAEPVSALYEQGRVHHVGNFGPLEDQLCSFTADYDRKANGSPDRLDALVWALTELMVQAVPEVPIVVPFVASRARGFPG